MVDDYPMNPTNDEVDRDAEMDDYEGYYDDAAMVDESGGGSTQLKEYDMEGDIEAEYEVPMMVAEPTDGMVTEQPPPTTTTVPDIPIMEEPTVAPSPADIPILPAVATTAVPQPLLNPPQPTPQHAASDLPITTFSKPPAEIPTVLSPVTPVVEATVNPIATSVTSEPQNPSPPPGIVPTTLTTEAKPAPETQAGGAPGHEESAPALPTAPSEAPQDQNTIAATVEAPEEATLPTQAVEEAVESSENGPTVIVPHITLYYNEQAFLLFAPHSEPEDSPPSLLSGRFELFVAPLDQLLRSLRSEETQHFSNGEDFVLGLEYPDLDLCIDENSKYATTYSLQNFCDALVACNHTHITLTLYQVTDFEYSLKQRLEGIMPEFPPLEDNAQLEPSTDDSAVQPEVQVHIPETLALRLDHAEAHPLAVSNSATQPGAPEEHSIQKQPQEIQAPEVESQHGQDDNRIAGHSEGEAEAVGVTVTEVPVEVPATELPPEVEENDEVDAHSADYSADAFGDEDLGEPVPPDDTQTSSNGMSGRAVEGTGDESTESSATLESSIHGEVEYSPEDGQPEDQPDEAHENPRVEPVTEDAASGHSTTQETSPLESNELIESQSQANSQEVDEEAIEHDELDDSEAQELPLEKVGEISAQEDRQSAAHEADSSPGTSEYEEYEYEEYEEAEDQVEPTAHPDEETTHDALSAGPEPSTLDNDPAKTPPVSKVMRITPPGKRTLEERDAEDEYDYGIDDYESDAKRARVE